jgi:hypothetical protein
VRLPRERTLKAETDTDLGSIAEKDADLGSKEKASSLLDLNKSTLKMPEDPVLPAGA